MPFNQRSVLADRARLASRARLACARGILFGLGVAYTQGGCSHDKSVTEPPPAVMAATKQTTETEGEALPVGTGLPVVDLSGAYHPQADVAESGTRVASTALETWVYARPDTNGPKLGVLRAGALVHADAAIVQGLGCPGSFRAIKPKGYVCLGNEASLTLDHPIVRASGQRPNLAAKLPYIYGTVKRGGPMYNHLPSADELKAYEPHLAQHLRTWARNKEWGAPYAPELWQPAGAWDPITASKEGSSDSVIPWFLEGGKALPSLLALKGGGSKVGEVSTHNGVSFLQTVLWNGRRYGVTTDLRVLPTDRLRPIRGSDFHGFRVPEEAQLPFAIVRKQGAKRIGKGNRRQGVYEYRSVVGLTGHQRFVDGVLHYETKDGTWIDDRSASRVEVPRKMPGWAVKGERWIDIDVTKQLLTLYEGEKLLYATLVSSGEAGLGDPETTKSTKRGIFRIHTKFITTTMDSKTVGEEFQLRDVPYVQYFQDGYALHASYWHDVFGMPKSHGCVNLSPEDARRIFFFTEPHVPEGWHGASKALTGTVVFIHD